MMPQGLCVFLLSLTLFVPQTLFAAVDGGITLAQAKLIADLWANVVKAQDQLENAQSAEKASKERDLELAENALNNAVKFSSFHGKTMEAVVFALDILNQHKRIDELNTEKSSAVGDQLKVKVLEEQIKKAKESLDNTIKSQDQLSRLKALADERFRGFGFGVALGVTVDLGSNDRIDEASIDANNIVRVDKEDNIQANFILETHYFFTPNFALLGFGPEPGDWGWGPFVAIQPGTDDIIDAAGIGLMLGMKRAQVLLKDTLPERGDSFNLGIGYVVNPNETILRDDFKANEPAPAGATDVRYKTKAQGGLLILFSYSF
ncbi:MAG: hypothetical protein AB7T38_18875 [Nitrospirales bacterium]